MKIAFFVGRFPSISETFILNQITGLLDAGHEVDIYANEHPQETRVHQEVMSYNLLDRTKYLSVPDRKIDRIVQAVGRVAGDITRNSGRLLGALNVPRYGQYAYSLRLLFMVHPFLQKAPYDILHCHFGTLGLPGAFLKQMGVAKKLVVAFHGYDISKVLAVKGENTYQQVFRKADLLLPISGFWRDRLIQIGADSARVLIHRMGTDIDQFQYHPRKLGEDEPMLLLTVGRLVEKKGIEYGIRAVGQVLRRHPDWNIQYDIIGDGPQLETLETLISDLNLSRHVHLLGPHSLTEVQHQLMASHVFLLPSVTDLEGDQEGIPVSLMEAMATGMPVLSTYHTGIPELVQDGRSGYLVPERDVDSLADKMELLCQNPHLWPELGRNGREIVARNHDIHKLNQNLLSIYEQLLAEEAPVLEASA